MLLYTIILCSIFTAITHAPLVLHLIVLGKSKSIKHNIIETAQHSLKGSLFNISGSAVNRLKIMHLNKVCTYGFVNQLFFDSIFLPRLVQRSTNCI